MARPNPWKIGIGTGAILLGTYIALALQDSFVKVIVGIALVAFGIGLIAST